MTNKYLLIFLLLLFQQSFGQVKNYNFININSKDGLASNTVYAIYKDKLGFMWFGTEDGLNKFDGQNFTVYRHKQNEKESIGRGEVMAITEDINRNLWIGTKLTLALYNRSSDKFTNFDFTKTGWIHTLSSDHSGNIWVGTYNGLFYFDTKTRKTKAISLHKGDSKKVGYELVFCIFEDSKKQIWVGSQSGLYLLDRNQRVIKKYVHQNNNSNSLSDNTVRAITEDRNGNLWIGTNLGLDVMNPNTGKIESFKSIESDERTISNNIINKIIFDADGNLWVGTENGMSIFDITTRTALRIKSLLPDKNNPFGSFAGYKVKDIYIGKDGINWFATVNGGVNKYDKNLAFFQHRFHLPNETYGLKGSSVMAFAEAASGNLYVGTDGGGLNIFDTKKNVFYDVPLYSSQGKIKNILALEKKGDDLIIGTTNDGIVSINEKTHQIKPLFAIKDKLNKSVVLINCLKADSKGNLWVGTNGAGLYICLAQSNTFVPFKNILDEHLKKQYTLNSYITAIEEDKEGNIWVGSNGSGLIIYNADKQTLSAFNQKNENFPIHRILSIYSDKRNRTWVSVWGEGLCLYNKKRRKFEQYGEEHLLSNNVIYKILEDNAGKLWLSTNKGISMFDLSKKRFKNFTYRNGIQNTTFNIGAGIKTKTGEMYFGGLDGFNFFNPIQLFQNTKTPSVVITDIKINNKRANPTENSELKEDITLAKEINLSYKQNFSLDFVALNYTAPHENQYTYQLEGFDKEWNNVGSVTTAVYTNLDPGKYIFRLKVKSEDGTWQTPEKTILINVHPPFWRTYYAYIIYLAVLIFTLWVIRRRGVQKLKNEFALEQERTEAERRMELEQLKIKFLTNLSHELKTPLTLILNPVENLLFREKNNDKIEMLNLINRNSKRLLNLVNQLLDFRKIEENELKLNSVLQDLVPLVKEIFDSFKYIASQKNIHLEFASNIDEYNTYFDKNKMERILINLLSNAIKFTNENGNVYCHVKSLSNNGIELIIGDSGIGIPHHMQAEVFERFFQVSSPSHILNQGSGIGLSIAQEFVKLHGGTIKLASEEYKGSVFTLYFPFIKEQQKINQTNKEDEKNESESLSYIEKSEDEIEVTEKPVVLIVDDSYDLRIFLRESLKSKYKIIEAADGKQGWQKTLSSHPEIIVSDVNMPNMDGIEMVNKIKKDERTKHIPVILLTVLTDEVEQLEGLKTGANDYLTKPFSFEVLSIKIDNLLKLNSTFKNTYKKQINIETSETEVVLEDEKFLLKINKYIDEHIHDSELSIEELSQKMNMSRGTLYSKLLKITGETPIEYIRSIKLTKALPLLEKSDMKISQIAYEAGFSNPNYFTRAFKIKYEISPTEYIKLKRGK
ncbi:MULTISPECIES: two-component regulator propeller domain-containing protein [unclassified Arcicella]|uniref:hybrid sensor histidine kinase/response regulator transcription factor n=1 Tax=unclassified Arcicella TaxID=2644986 RepID=UPI002867A95B|nr:MULTISPECIES: two-component regulator propeller domain-containing protein [unclassified Arcicella]MDR6562367.1 signal transduction histidine kinase/ligand-binding sensor domain-containing protein/DNA-binding response OmpR family regulator [Arcicella sp. BE51]MDR6812261.1 signal transduction histidine kinase/ligand-binding sensor domain-containing protein/DNA-binding response OmpR family regulator [Arcicella sp. BE140]MDR6823592.1 signal transduction histidine kinase/ligand-binding sensor doma